MMKIYDLPIGSFGRIVQGKWTGRIGYRTESCFFLIDEPEVDWLNTAGIFVEQIPTPYSFLLKYPTRAANHKNIL